MGVVLLMALSALWMRFGVGPAYISPDGTGYFSYFHSLLIDRDLDFENEFRDMQMPAPGAATPTGYLNDLWPVGTSWVLFPAGLWARALHHLFVRGIGHDALHWLLIFFNLGSSLCGLAAVGICTLGLRDSGCNSVTSFFTALAAFLGTPLFFYTFSAPSTPHAVSALMTGLFLFYWMRSYHRGGRGLQRWFFLGILLGAAGTVRTEILLYGIAPLCEWAGRRFKRDPAGPLGMKYPGVLALGALIGFSPQLFCWKIMNGSFFYSPEAFNVSMENFSLTSLIFSPFHGVLTWTPLFLLGILGLVFPRRADGAHRALFLCVLAQVLIAACSLTWWFGYSFGIRILTSCFFPVALGLGRGLRELRGPLPASARIFPVLMAGAVAWTLSLCLQAMIGWIDLGGFVFSFKTLLGWQARSLEVPLAALAVFFRNRYLSGAEFVLIFLSVWGLIGVLWALRRTAQKNPARFFTVCAVFFLVLIDLNLFRAWRNGPRTRSDAGVLAEDLAKDFLVQGLYARWYYELNTNDLSRAEKTIERHLRADPRSEEAKKALIYVRLKRG